MNRYLLMSAAALLATTAPACADDLAKTHTIHFSNFCDGLSFQKTGHHHAAGQHLNEDCNGKVGEMSGTVDKKAFHLNESVDGGLQTIDVFKPIRNGGTWDLWVCISGLSCFMANEGTYLLGPPGHEGGRKPIRSKVARTIAEFKAIRAHEGK